MFSIISWYEYHYGMASYIYDSIDASFAKLNVAKCIQDKILEYIRCPKCCTMYQGDGDCYCWIITVYYAEITIIPDIPDEETNYIDSEELITV